MKTIYAIYGGGQKVQQCAQAGMPVTITVLENSDWSEKSGVAGSNFFTNVMWSEDVDELKEWATEWANGYGDIEFVEE